MFRAQSLVSSKHAQVRINYYVNRVSGIQNLVGVQGIRSLKSGSGNGNGESDSKPDVPIFDPSNVLLNDQGPQFASELKHIPALEFAPKPARVTGLSIGARPLFPGFITPIPITDSVTWNALVEVFGSPSPYLGLFSDNGSVLVKTHDVHLIDRKSTVNEIGTFAHLMHMQLSKQGPGGVIMVLGHRRIRLDEVLPDPVGSSPLSLCSVTHIDVPRERDMSPRTKALLNEIILSLRELVKVSTLLRQNVSFYARKIDVTNPHLFTDFIGSLLSYNPRATQEVLATLDLEARMERVLVLLRDEFHVVEMQKRIKVDVEKRMEKNHRNNLLHEQLRSIKKELGLDNDDKEALARKFTARIAKLDMPPEAKRTFDEELERLNLMDRNQSEYILLRTYLDWLTSLPWGVYSRDSLDLARARRILDEDHYGLKEVKERILETIAVGKLRGHMSGKILCLVGPPGVGKTSIAKSIARALEKKYYRIALGGLADVSELKGHRRTYVGSLPGRFVSALKSTGVSNPLVLLDEIDKLGTGRNGDPASALLELLDPNQNHAFLDHYLDIPIDASRVLFVCTANSVETIPGPLLDRMEIISLDGYDFEEKLAIARNYLIPKLMEEAGLAEPSDLTKEAEAVDALEPDGTLMEKKSKEKAPKIVVPPSLGISDAAVSFVIKWYARESGVRKLEGLLGKIVRKLAMKVVEAREKALPLLLQQRKSIRVKADEDVEAVTSADSSAGANADHTPSADEREVKAAMEGLFKEIDLANAKAAHEGSEMAKHAAAEPEPEEVLVPEVDDPAWMVVPQSVESFIGPRVYTSESIYEETPPGVALGMAYTSNGGCTLYIEVVSPFLHRLTKASSDSAGSGTENTGVVTNDAVHISSTPDGQRTTDEDSSTSISVPSAVSTTHNKKKYNTGAYLHITGQLGTVMKESAEISYTVAKRFFRSIDEFADNDFLDITPLHMHVPDGAVPKDGPSAGITITTAILSLAMNKPVRPHLAMSGEIDLMGNVMRVGGIREKLLAAGRVGTQVVILPEECRGDYEELSDYQKGKFKVHFVSKYEQVFDIAFNYDPSDVKKLE